VIPLEIKRPINYCAIKTNNFRPLPDHPKSDLYREIKLLYLYQLYDTNLFSMADKNQFNSSNVSQKQHNFMTRT